MRAHIHIHESAVKYVYSLPKVIVSAWHLRFLHHKLAMSELYGSEWLLLPVLYACNIFSHISALIVDSNGSYNYGSEYIIIIMHP